MSAALPRCDRLSSWPTPVFHFSLLVDIEGWQREPSKTATASLCLCATSPHCWQDFSHYMWLSLGAGGVGLAKLPVFYNWSLANIVGLVVMSNLSRSLHWPGVGLTVAGGGRALIGWEKSGSRHHWSLFSLLISAREIWRSSPLSYHIKSRLISGGQSSVQSCSHQSRGNILPEMTNLPVAVCEEDHLETEVGSCHPLWACGTWDSQFCLWL